jgi:MscS family membrane protein
VRVRFVRLGASSLDVEIFAYLLARDWNHFLEIQEDLLLRVMEIIQHAGTEIAFPSQTMYLATHSSDKVAQKWFLNSEESAGLRGSMMRVTPPQS